MKALLLITNDRTVMEHAVWLDGPVVRVEHVGGARRAIAAGDYEFGLVAWGPEQVEAAEEHWRLPLPGTALWTAGDEHQLTVSAIRVLGLDRTTAWPEGIPMINEELWPELAETSRAGHPSFRPAA